VNGVTYLTNGLYNDTAFYLGSGCDSVQYVINLSFDNFVVENIDTTICQGQSLIVNGVTYAASGLYNDTAFYFGSGCDSVQYVIDLQIDNFSITNIDTILCFGESLTVNGLTYNASGFYQDTLAYSISACDQIQYNIELLILDEKLGLVDTAICAGESIFVNGTEYNTTTQGAIEVFVVGPEACDSSVTVNVLVNPLPSLLTTANPDTIFLGDVAELTAIGAGSFDWDGGQSDGLIEVGPIETTSYTVLLTDTNGCVSESTVTVYVIGAAADQILVPDAFTPNGDNVNDEFRVIPNGAFVEIELTIYNRWGELLHRKSGVLTHGWNGTYQGKDQPIDTYVYRVMAKTFDGQVFNVTGNVTLIR
jgi:gliding motility-associated-like protein